MNKTIELSTGKVVDLSRFVALIPNDDTTGNRQYSLILEGSAQSINLNSEEVISIKKYLQVNAEKKHNGSNRPKRLRDYNCLGSHQSLGYKRWDRQS